MTLKLNMMRRSSTDVYVKSQEVTLENEKSEDVIYRGEGQFLPPVSNTPNCAAVHRSDHRQPFFDDIYPPRHLKVAAQKTDVKVAIIGDSLATPFADSAVGAVGGSDTLWSYLKSAFVLNNPGKNFEFVNRAIGGMTFTNANQNKFGSVPGNIEWYVEDKNWLDYLNDDAPDVLIVAFGMNDSRAFVAAQFRLMMQTINTFNVVPDVIFCTNMVPSRMTENASISDFANNDGRDFVAGYVRNYAKANDYGLIDINRQYHVVRDGIDVLNTATREVVASSSVSLPFVGSGFHCSDYTMKIDFSALPAGVFNDLNSGTNDRLRLKISPDNPNSSGWLDLGVLGGNLAIEVIDQGDGFNANRYGAGAGGFGYLQIDTGVVLPSVGAALNLVVTVKSGFLIVAMNDVHVLSIAIQRCGGVFEPGLFMRDGSVSVSTSVALFSGQYIKLCAPILTDAEMWGSLGSGEGGNDINHCTGRAAALIYGEVFSMSSVNIPVLIEEGEKLGIGQKVPRGFLHVGDGVDDSYTPNPDANGGVFEGKGVTVLAADDSYSIVRFESPSGAVGHVRYDHAAGKLVFKTDGVDALEVTSTITRSRIPIRSRAENGVASLDSSNRSMQFSLVSDTELRIYVRGNDGVARSASLVLS